MRVVTLLRLQVATRTGLLALGFKFSSMWKIWFILRKVSQYTQIELCQKRRIMLHIEKVWSVALTVTQAAYWKCLICGLNHCWGRISNNSDTWPQLQLRPWIVSFWYAASIAVEAAYQNYLICGLNSDWGHISSISNTRPGSLLGQLIGKFWYAAKLIVWAIENSLPGVMPPGQILGEDGGPLMSLCAAHRNQTIHGIRTYSRIHRIHAHSQHLFRQKYMFSQKFCKSLGNLLGQKMTQWAQSMPHIGQNQ